MQKFKKKKVLKPRRLGRSSIVEQTLCSTKDGSGEEERKEMGDRPSLQPLCNTVKTALYTFNFVECIALGETQYIPWTLGNSTIPVQIQIQ